MSTEVLQIKDDRDERELVLKHAGSRGSRRIAIEIHAPDGVMQKFWFKWSDVAVLHQWLGVLLGEAGVNTDGYFEDPALQPVLRQ